MNALKKAALLCALFSLALSAHAQTAVSGSRVVDNTGALLSSGQWCFGAQCLTVTNGAFSGTVTAGTQTVTVTNGGATTYLTVPGVVVGSSAFSWDSYVVPTTSSTSGMGNPRIACAPGATYTQTDAAPAVQNWACTTSPTGQAAWVNVHVAPAVPSGTYAGNNAPSFNCTAPCIYIQQNAAASSSVWSWINNAWSNLQFGFNPRGAWAASTAYQQNDVVTYQGSSYYANSSFTSGSSFNPANWTLLASVGASGPISTGSVNTAAPSAGATASGSNLAVNLPLASVPATPAGLIPSRDYNNLMSSLSSDVPKESFANTAFIDRGTAVIGLGRVLNPTNEALTFDSVWTPIDPTPNGGVPAFQALNPQLQLFIYDTTTSTMLFQQTLQCSQWCSTGFGNGGILWRMSQGVITIPTTDTVEIGLSTDKQGMGLPTSAAGPSSLAGFTSTFTTNPAAWDSWTYTGAYLSLAFLNNNQVVLSPTAQTAISGVRAWSTPPTLVSTSLSAKANQVSPTPGIYAWGSQFTPATTWSNINAIGIYPFGSISNPVRIACSTADQLQVFTFGDVTANEWNTAAASATELQVKLNIPFTATSGVPFFCYYHAFGQPPGYTMMAVSSETGATRMLGAVALDWNHYLPTLTAATNNGFTIYMHFYSASGTQTPGIVLSTAQLEAGIFGTPDVLLPRNVYAFAGSPGATISEEFNIYTENVLGGMYNPTWWKSADFRWSASPNFGMEGSGRWWIEPGNTSGNANSQATWFNITSGNIALTLNVNDAAGNSIAAGSTSVNIVPKTNTTNPIRLLVIGDSQSTDYGAGYITQAAAELPGANVTTVGTRTNGTGFVNMEGRPGWTFNNGNAGYMTSICSTTQPDSPFLFPNGVSAANYRGNTTFWANVVNGTGGSAYAGFVTASKEGTGSVQYGTNGYPLTPTTGWVVCDPTQPAGSKYQQYNGTSWAAMGTQPSGATFSFANYLTRYAWAFPNGSPTHVAILLGTNDFFTTVPTGTALSTFLSSYNTMIASIQAAVPGVKIVVQIPPAGSAQDGFAWAYGTTSTTYLSFRTNMQLLARQLLNTYDTPAQNTAGIYVVSHLTDIDPVYGWQTQNIQANKFTAATIATQNNGVHPAGGTGYQQMGDELAAAVQSLR